MEKLQGNHKDIYLWTQKETVEEVAIQQLINTASLPIIFNHLAVMPDVHYGKGATVGSVIATKEALIPAAVGVDIACGMGAILTNLTIEEIKEVGVSTLRTSIERTIPTGFHQHSSPAYQKYEDSTIYNYVKDLIENFQTIHRPGIKCTQEKAALQLGTLGGGNHFIELNHDSTGRIWIMLHSGSRYIGKELAEYHIKVAKNLPHNQQLPDKDLAYLIEGTPEFKDYLEAVDWAQQYAWLNRQVMAELIIRDLSHYFPHLKTPQMIWCHHNFIKNENHYGENVWITRKGAINASKDVMGIIPGSMGTSSYIVKGKGNQASFESASHGAGRRMSRTGAKRNFDINDLDKQMAGIEFNRSCSVIDEIPGAYKDIELVMKNQEDLVEIVGKLDHILVVKG